MRLAAEWKEAIAQNRLLLLSPFPAQQRRATAELAQIRNSFVATLSDTIFITYAAPGSRTELFAHQVLEWSKPVLTFDSSANQELIRLGATPLSSNAIKEW
jgi:predicted Rossmann fold nucleotide-binding protein DprA/Smf involved in DNA uptake